MARLGINATATFGTGSASVAGTGIKDLTIAITSTEVPIETRGFDFKRYLAGQRDVPIDFSAESNAPCVDYLRGHYWARTEFPVALTDAGGDSFTGNFIATKFETSSPVGGEEEVNVSLRLSALTCDADDQPTHTEANSGS